jgi:hypothetical protein
VAGATAFLVFDQTTGSNATSTEKCNTPVATIAGCFVYMPVVDVIIPELAGGTDQNGGVNEVLNVSTGQTTILHVQVYPEVKLNTTLSFSVSSYHSANISGITATFTPQQLSIALNGNGSSTVTLHVSNNLAPGTYYAAISATDVEHTPWVWGDYFNINVT